MLELGSRLGAAFTDAAASDYDFDRGQDVAKVATTATMVAKHCPVWKAFPATSSSKGDGVASIAAWYSPKLTP